MLSVQTPGLETKESQIETSENPQPLDNKIL